MKSMLVVLLALAHVQLAAIQPKAKTAEAAGLNKLNVPGYLPITPNAALLANNAHTYTTFITNNSAYAVTLYPYLNRVGMEGINWSDSCLLAWLRGQIAGLTDTDAIRLKLVQVVGSKIEKTNLFNHGQVIYAPGNSHQYAVHNSLMGALNGAYQKQCSSYIRNGISILIKTGWFNYSNIQVVQLQGHVTGAFLYKNGWAFFDFDPEEPYFMIADTANPNGYASPFDIQRNRNLVNPGQRYYYVTDAGDSIDLGRAVSLNKYRNRFDTVVLRPMAFNSQPLSIPGVIVLPAGASLVTSYQMPYVLDSASFALLSATYAQGRNKVFSTLGQILHIPPDSAAVLAKAGKISMDNSASNFKPDFRGITPTISIVLPPTRDTIFISDNPARGINFPGYILGSTVNISPGIFTAGNAPVLWMHSAPHVPSPVITDDEAQYLAALNGYIAPHPYKSDTISVSYNPGVLNFAAGFSLGYKKGGLIVAGLLLNGNLVTSNPTYKQTWPRPKKLRKQKKA